MTDADLTLRDEVAEVLHRGVPGVECSHVPGKQPSCERDADALLPLLARVREEGEARVRERVEAVLSDMEPGAIAPIVAIRAALAEPSGSDT